MLAQVLSAVFMFAFLQWAATGQAAVVATRVPATEHDIYSRALLAGLEEMTRQWGDMDDSAMGTRVRTDWRNLIVAKSETTAELTAQIQGFHIQCLDGRQLIERYRKLGKAFSILVIQPARIEGARVRVHVAMNWFSYEKRSMRQAISDWANVYFRFDCDKRQYVLDEVKLGGI